MDDSTSLPFSSSLLGPAWHHQPSFDNITDDEYETEEEVEYVTFDLGVVPSGTAPPSAQHYRLIGLDTPTPYLQLGTAIYQGGHASLIGSEIIFRDMRDPSSSKGTKHVLPQHLTSRHIRFRQVHIQPRPAYTRQPTSGPEGVQDKFGSIPTSRGRVHFAPGLGLERKERTEGVPHPLLGGAKVPRRSGTAPGGGKGKRRGRAKGKGKGTADQDGENATDAGGDANTVEVGGEESMVGMGEEDTMEELVPSGSGATRGRSRGGGRGKGRKRGRGNGKSRLQPAVSETASEADAEGGISAGHGAGGEEDVRMEDAATADVGGESDLPDDVGEALDGLVSMGDFGDGQ